jgi:hypothetical protein
MNEKGVRIQEAATVGIAFAAVFLPHRHVIDRPFLMWVERPGLSLPLFVGYISEEDWKKPGKRLELVPETLSHRCVPRDTVSGCGIFSARGAFAS